MKYKLSLLVGCMAVLLGVLFFAACDDKDKKDNGIESGYSLVGTWTHSEYDSYYGTTATVTIQFNKDHTGTYTYSCDGDVETNSMMYTYDATTCTVTILIYNDYGQEEMDFKLKWFDENTVTVYTYDEYYGEWESQGTFTRKGSSGGGGGTNPSGNTYSIVGTWKQSEYSSYYGWETTTIVFRANGTGTLTYSSGGNSSVYNLQYSYNETTCIGDLLMIYDDIEYGREYYPMQFKVVWYGANAALIYMRYVKEEYDDWEEEGVFERQ